MCVQEKQSFMNRLIAVYQSDWLLSPITAHLTVKCYSPINLHHTHRDTHTHTLISFTVSINVVISCELLYMLLVYCPLSWVNPQHESLTLLLDLCTLHHSLDTFRMCQRNKTSVMSPNKSFVCDKTKQKSFAPSKATTWTHFNHLIKSKLPTIK